MRVFKNTIILLFLLCLWMPLSTFAQSTQAADWYFKDFVSDITLNPDSSATIVEKITANCPNCVDRHGIFRIVPTRTKLDTGTTIKNPVKLISITDFSNNAYPYSETLDRSNATITWKIGDKDKTVTGVNNYIITYKVDNVIRNQGNFDEFYWNLLGNYFELEIDQFSATVHFPSKITKNNVDTWLYSGFVGSKDNQYADFKWLDDSTISINSKQALPMNYGITLSAKFPQGNFTYWQPSWYDKYGLWLWLCLPIIVFILCFWLWSKFGRDPLKNRTIVPEFDIPDKLPPLKMSAILGYGSATNQAITAEIVNLAIKKVIKIEEISASGLFKKTDYRLIKLKTGTVKLLPSEQKLIDILFAKGDRVELQDLAKEADTFIKISQLRQTIRSEVTSENYIQSNSIWIWGILLGLGSVLIFLGITFGPAFSDGGLVLGLVLSGLIIIIFAIFMPKRTVKGAQSLLKIEGFKLYMTTAERYRQQFNEKENIFERFLPYAILFGLTKKWIKTCQNLYGEKYFNTYHPYWYVGSLSTFNLDSFTSTINNLSTSIGSSVGTSSGAGGAGGAGGGGGGGGGGGW